LSFDSVISLPMRGVEQFASLGLGTGEGSGEQLALPGVAQRAVEDLAVHLFL
jgi:hypothetical protein